MAYVKFTTTRYCWKDIVLVDYNIILCNYDNLNTNYKKYEVEYYMDKKGKHSRQCRCSLQYDVYKYIFMYKKMTKKFTSFIRKQIDVS